MNNLLKIVLTGAPGSGKTIILNKLKEEKSFSHFLFFDEMARLLLEKNPEFRDNWHEFHIQIFEKQILRENEAKDLNLNQSIIFLLFHQIKRSLQVHIKEYK